MDKRIKHFEFEELKRQNDIISGVVGNVTNNDGNNYTVDQSYFDFKLKECDNKLVALRNEFEQKLSRKDSDIEKLNTELTECYSNLTDLRQILSYKSECMVNIENVCEQAH